MNTTIAVFLRNERMRRNLTQKEFAKVLGVSPRTLEYYENGERSPQLMTVWRMASALQMSPQDLFKQLTDYPTPVSPVSNPLETEPSQTSEPPTSDEASTVWAIVELMGHRRRAGRIREQTIAGASMVRIDIPMGSGDVTEYYAAHAIYSIAPVSEQVARTVAPTLYSPPVRNFELPRPQEPLVLTASTYVASFTPAPDVYGEEDAAF